MLPIKINLDQLKIPNTRNKHGQYLTLEINMYTT